MSQPATTPEAPLQAQSDVPAPAAPEIPHHHIPRHLWLLTRFVCVPLMAFATGFFGTLALLASLWDRSGRQQHAIARVWAAVFLRIALSPVALVGADKLQADQSAVYACNHLSYMDTPALFATLPFQFRILAKAGLWKIPFVGWYLNRSGQVPIDEGSPRTAIAGLLRGVATLKAGMPLVLFPEGSRSTDGRLHESASGAAFMAIRAGVPLVPLALVGTYELLPIHTYSLRPRPLKLIVGDPIPTAGLSTRDADALTTRLHAAIATLYYAHADIQP